MQISNTLPQFELRTLFLTTSTLEGRFYEAHDGMLREIASFSIPKQEGNRESRLSGAESRIAFAEKGDAALRHDFLRALKQECKKPEVTRTERAFVFAPSTVKEAVLDALPLSMREKIAGVYDGIFLSLHPFKLIEMASKDIEERIVAPRSAEAEKILRVAPRDGKKRKNSRK